MSRRLIDADDFIVRERKLYCKDCDSYNGVRCRACWVADITGDLDDYADAPTIDAVEVVRCRNCICFMEYTDEYKQRVQKADGDCYYRLLNSLDEQFCGVQYDDYCSMGKRKETT